ncbi:hypothetical protein [Methylobacterium sp. Leaf99]|uniref:hypothetical protein n=1 Tax=Methylobacterium sp. Leaf99 TaxID=1736251 RepID=UPI000AC02674|nr:hypothetical protein [Methylobacterium sp. Leaf99]
MAHARNMALWLVAVIVLIAVFAVPSGAEAHAGRMHAGHAPAGPDRTAAVTPLPASVAATFLAATSVVSAGVDRASAESGLAHPCDGACCRPGTACCTGTALAPETHPALPARGPEARAHARALPARTDVVPEALPEPPRSFA